MSMDRCQACEALVDTDCDCGFYVPMKMMPGEYFKLCERCREKLPEDDEFSQTAPAEPGKGEK